MSVNSIEEQLWLHCCDNESNGELPHYIFQIYLAQSKGQSQQGKHLQEKATRTENPCVRRAILYRCEMWAVGKEEKCQVEAGWPLT